MIKPVLILSTLLLTSCFRVPTGHVAVRVSTLGSDKGTVEVMSPGRYIDTPWIEFYSFPTHMQNKQWSGLSFQTKEGMSVSVNVGLSYSIEESAVKSIFVNHNKGIDEITNSYVRTIIRDAFNTTASQYNVSDVYGVKKNEFLAKVTTLVKSKLEPMGFRISMLSLEGAMELPTVVMQALNNKIAATQRAEQRENELREEEAGAKKALIAARAEAEVNRLKATQITPELLEYEKIKNQGLAIAKWDGKMPHLQAGNGTDFIFGLK